MQKIKTLIVDDEQNNIEVLLNIINDFCPNIHVVATACNIELAYKAIKTHQPELVLLDIEMPNGTGFDLLNKITNLNFNVIFITAFNHYAIKAIKYAAVDYILKPVNIEELQQAIEKVSHQILKKDYNFRIENLLNSLQFANKPISKITIPTHDGFVYEDVNEIMYLHANGNYTTLFVNKKYKIVASRTIKDFEEMLPNQFFCRVHNSYIINIKYVTKFKRQGRGGTIEMLDGSEIEVSVRKKDDFLNMINSI